MGKRANQGGAKTATKKAKIAPALALVVDTVKKAGHLPEQCSAMLASMLPFSLAIASDERSDSQQRVVGMVEETLEALKANLETLIADEDAKLNNLQATMAGLLDTVKEAEATLATRKEAQQVASASLTDATAASNASSEILAEQQSAKAARDATFASAQEDKAALEDAFQTHFRAPMEVGEGPHFKELEPFFETMEMEQSMRSTLPGTCSKSKENRGAFDDVILEQLEKAVLAKIASLSETVAAETLAVAEREAAVKEAEADCNSKKEAQNSLTVELEVAEKAQTDAEAAFTKANEAVNELRPQLEEATGLCEIAKTNLDGFETGPLANFVTYKSRTVSAEAAPLGA